MGLTLEVRVCVCSLLRLGPLRDGYVASAVTISSDYIKPAERTYRECAVGAFEWLIVGVERPVVALEVFLAAEATRAQIADEGL